GGPFVAKLGVGRRRRGDALRRSIYLLFFEGGPCGESLAAVYAVSDRRALGRRATGNERCSHGNLAHSFIVARGAVAVIGRVDSPVDNLARLDHPRLFERNTLAFVFGVSRERHLDYRLAF